MNTNDFYKELFEKYALDEDKIRRNAIKAAKTPAWQRAVSAHWKTAVGAAAAVAVTVGAVAYTVGNSAGNIEIDPVENLPSAYQRLRDAEQQYMNAAIEDESKVDIYVSFLDDLCYGDMSVSFSALPDAESIDIVCLYLNDGTVIRGEADIEKYAENSANAVNIAGAKLVAPMKAYRDIVDLSKVCAAELRSETINDDTFSPIDSDDVDPLTNAYEFISTTALAESTTTPFSFAVEVTTTEISSVSTDADTTEPPEDSEEVDPDGEPEDTEETDPDETDKDSSVTGETSEASTTAASEVPDATSVTTVSETTVAASEFVDPPEIGLMTQIYQLNVENALETILVKDCAIVLTRNNAYIYKMNGLIKGIENIYEISNPKVAYMDDNYVILTGCGASGRRNTVLAFDMKRETVNIKDAGESLGEAEIGTVNYSLSADKFFLKAVSASTTYLYELIINTETGIQFRPLVESEGVVSPAGYKNGWLWYAAADENMKYSLYTFNCEDGTARVEYSFGNVCKIRRSKNFESFIISTSDAETNEPRNYVFSTSNGLLIPVEISGDALIADANGIVYIGFDNKTYTLATDGTLSEYTGRPIHFVSRPDSKYQVISTDPDKVEIAEKRDIWGS